MIQTRTLLPDAGRLGQYRRMEHRWDGLACDNPLDLGLVTKNAPVAVIQGLDGNHSRSNSTPCHDAFAWWACPSNDLHVVPGEPTASLKGTTDTIEPTTQTLPCDHGYNTVLPNGLDPYSGIMNELFLAPAKHLMMSHKCVWTRVFVSTKAKSCIRSLWGCSTFFIYKQTSACMG